MVNKIQTAEIQTCRDDQADSPVILRGPQGTLPGSAWVQNRGAKWVWFSKLTRRGQTAGFGNDVSTYQGLRHFGTFRFFEFATAKWQHIPTSAGWVPCTFQRQVSPSFAGRTASILGACAWISLQWIDQKPSWCLATNKPRN